MHDTTPQFVFFATVFWQFIYFDLSSLYRLPLEVSSLFFTVGWFSRDVRLFLQIKNKQTNDDEKKINEID